MNNKDLLDFLKHHSVPTVTEKQTENRQMHLKTLKLHRQNIYFSNSKSEKHTVIYFKVFVYNKGLTSCKLLTRVNT